MIPVEQKVIDAVNGDCFAACLASILELPECPNIHGGEHSDVWSKWNQWLAPRNLQIIYYQFGSAPPPKGYAIAAVKSALFEGKPHAVVWYEDGAGIGRIVWNPNPQDPRGCNIPFEDYRLFHVLALVDPARNRESRAESNRDNPRGGLA